MRGRSQRKKPGTEKVLLGTRLSSHLRFYLSLVASENTDKHDGNNPTASLSIKMNRFRCLRIDRDDR